MCRGWGSSEAPEHGHSLADAHVVVVEVAEASEGQGRQDVQPRVGHFNGDISVHIISDDLAQTPEQERKAQISKVRSLKSILSVSLFCHRPFLKNAQFPHGKRKNLFQKQTKTFQIPLKTHRLAQSFLKENKC